MITSSLPPPKSSTYGIPEVIAHDGKPTTTSIAVAKRFSRNHRDVLRAVQTIVSDGPSEFNERNFALVNYTDAKGEARPMYHLTKNGFALLAMGFTGKDALKWKIAYIQAFDDMERHIKESASLMAEPYARGYREGVEHTARHFLGVERVQVARDVFMTHDEGISQSLVARAVGVSRHVVARILKRLAFLRPVYRSGQTYAIRSLLQLPKKAR